MTVYCCSCNCPIESEVCEYDALQEERERDPSIGWVRFLCQLCAVRRQKPTSTLYMMKTREEAIAEINAALTALDHLKHRASCQSERARYAEPVEAFLRGLLDHITVAAPPAGPYPDPPAEPLTIPTPADEQPAPPAATDDQEL